MMPVVTAPSAVLMGASTFAGNHLLFNHHLFLPTLPHHTITKNILPKLLAFLQLLQTQYSTLQLL